jgi:hypothetical protein
MQKPTFGLIATGAPGPPFAATPIESEARKREMEVPMLSDAKKILRRLVSFAKPTKRPWDSNCRGMRARVGARRRVVWG